MPLSIVNDLLRADRKHRRTPAPQTVNDTIPITEYYEDGIFQLEGEKYSKSWKFSDINYADLDDEKQESVLVQYQDILTGLEPDTFHKITIINRRLNREEFQKAVLMPLAGDDKDFYRREYNKMLEEKAQSGSSIVQDKYLTITVVRPDVESARAFFRRVGPDIAAKFAKLGSKLEELSANERMKVLYSFYHPNDEAPYDFDLALEMQRGQDPAAYFAPAHIGYDDNYLKIVNGSSDDGFYCKSFYLMHTASLISTQFISELVSLNRSLSLSVDFRLVARDEAIRIANNAKLNVEANILAYQKKQVEQNNFAAELPFKMVQEREHATELQNDLTNRDKGMVVACLTLTLCSNTKEELEYDTAQLMTTVRTHSCQFGDMWCEQIEGLNVALGIYGANDVMGSRGRPFTTEEMGAFIPFEVQEIRHNGGIYYGQNKISNNLIIIDRHQFQNGNSFILGKSGAGKSFTGKNEVINILLRDPNADVLVLDPEREYRKIAQAFDGAWLELSTSGDTHINAMDINAEYGEGDNDKAIAMKSTFIMSLINTISNGKFDATYMSLVDMCTRKVYQKYIRNNYSGWVPTLVDLKKELEKQRHPEAREIALLLESYTSGSLNTFAKKTNVDTNNRLIVFDIKNLDGNLRAAGMLVVMDFILNRITKNRESGRRTYIFIDEIYLLFRNKDSAEFLQELWKRVRKYNAMCTGMTQNVTDLLQSYTAQTMLGNSEFIIMLNQYADDREILAEQLRISEDQQRHLIDAETGSGLIKMGDTLVPFYNRFPKNALYELMHTDPEDRDD